MTATGRAFGVLAETVRDGKLSRPAEPGGVWLMAGTGRPGAGDMGGAWFVEPVRMRWSDMVRELFEVARYRRNDGDTVTVWRGRGWVRLAVRERGSLVILAEVWRPVEVVR